MSLSTQVYNKCTRTYSFEVILQGTKIWSTNGVLILRSVLCLNKNALTAAFSLSCLEIRSKKEEAINSTWNGIYSLKVFLLPTLPTSILSICFWIDLVGVLATTGNTPAVAGYTRENSRASIPEKLHHCQRSKKWFTWHVISIIAENKPHGHHKSHLHTMKVYNTRPSQFC